MTKRQLKTFHWFLMFFCAAYFLLATKLAGDELFWLMAH